MEHKIYDENYGFESINEQKYELLRNYIFELNEKYKDNVKKKWKSKCSS